MQSKDPNCFDCHHFFVTWDPGFPRGCRVFGVKSRDLPSVIVHRSTGRSCPAFLQSERIRKRREQDQDLL